MKENILLVKFEEGLTYNDFWNQFELKLNSQKSGNLSEEEKNQANQLKLNFQRSSRINRTYEISENLKNVLDKLEITQNWILITEDWCGDSAQNVPYIAKIANYSSKINLRILARDQNLDLMDKYLTNGARAIPKLIAFDEQGDELFQWGARPKEAQDLVTQLKNEGKSKTEFLEALHLWYGKNRGKNLETEFLEILQKLI
ncbi:MAG: thioredoxin family protein [Ignavibacteria bacterium]|nr:thioredoxin family protein [Ignavibacteria bacterium]